ncbi:alpha/beta fold hydrolase [Lysobacter korlensis]|uniref:Alpha/beta fold hydrolase n=1 Tax=Lysobacter korlensis TaxID=553636 RepID=A0ABV6RQ80_9GAMM
MPEAPEQQPLPAQASDGHRWDLLSSVPSQPRAALLWLPALGVAARHYAALASALAAHGIAVFVHEWRGHGSSSLRAGRRSNWAYHELLTLDLASSRDALTSAVPASVPVVLGGHSLGGQLAACRLALAPGDASALWLVASGSPYWRAFPPPQRRLLPLAYRALPWLADRCGALPGRRIGFGGREARGVMRDWSRSALEGRYAAAGLDIDLEHALARVEADVTGIVFEHDWLAPASSLQALLEKMPAAHARIARIDDRALGTRSDHFGWMKQPSAVARLLAESLPAAPR